MANGWSFLTGWFRRQRIDRDVDAVTVDDEGVRRVLADGRTEAVRWDELASVELLTTDDGPLADDVFWLLLSDDGGCAVPGSSASSGDLLARLQCLPGFDNEAVIRAMGSTQQARFQLWHRHASGVDAPKPLP